MKKYLKILLTLMLLVLIGGLNACKEGSTTPPAPEDKITAISLDFSAEGKGKQDVSFQLREAAGIDGKQSSSPVRLQANTTYTLETILRNESQSPSINITNFYETTYQVTGPNVTFTNTGQEIRVQTTTATTNTDGLLRLEMKKDTKVQSVTIPLLVSQ